MKMHGQTPVLGSLFLLFSLETYGQSWTRSEIHLDEKMDIGTPVFSLELSHGEPSLINFWATWCAPCIKEIPDLISAARAMDEQIVLVNVGESREKITKFANQFPQLELGQAAVVTQGFEFKDLQQWEIRGLPTSFLVRDEQPHWQAEGILEWADPRVQAEIRALLTPQ